MNEVDQLRDIRKILDNLVPTVKKYAEYHGDEQDRERMESAMSELQHLQLQIRKDEGS